MRKEAARDSLLLCHGFLLLKFCCYLPSDRRNIHDGGGQSRQSLRDFLNNAIPLHGGGWHFIDSCALLESLRGWLA